MFLEMTLKRNEGLIRSAVKLHQEGIIPANTYVIDLDTLEHNVKKLSLTASEHGLNLYYMTKQIGRSAFAGQVIEQNGIERAVAVDIDEAFELKKGNCRIGNIGHIVQPSRSQWPEVLTKLNPEVVTLFSVERARQLSEAAVKLGKVQDVILRVIKPEDLVYPGQFGGFILDQLDGQLADLLKLKGIRVIGITSFPVLQLNEEKNDFAFTSNIETIVKSREVLENKGIAVTHVNAPSATSCHTIPMLKDYGVTHGEPGHALTGTTPLHAYREDLQEIPGIVYASEISHMDEKYAYTIAGGYYARSNMEGALYGSNGSAIISQRTTVDCVSPENIDYYGCLERKNNMNVGDSVIQSFRTQIFVTRAHVAYVRNVNSENPELVFFQRRGM
ncbi:amino-acid racemase [Bacillus canaveralius]|uniref:Amino-acid racemase n=1 Tax=Bacillus canaveralius TaxID=1403243 RepID=A0A2N5GM67_9BACI|nr:MULTISPECIES: YhfX family PLP-dependent enzyme [Bacillus]PLR80607.1 amino-acid racemase [Bacillus sp. V33-4]PLR82952.1 amino-acid racemase [Bacillus canaveralius]PLR97043.1 amino-acid racemase [Bacillus canaveralius]